MSRRCLPPLALVLRVLALSALLLCVRSSAVGAQEPTAVEGAADFRTAPRLVDGVYTDRAVAGESVWYGILYTSNTPYEHEVRLLDQAPPDTTFAIQLVSPTLEPVGSSDETKIASTASFGPTGAHMWYLQVTLATTGEVGEAYDFELRITGATGGRNEPCGAEPDCKGPDDVTTAEEANDRAQADLAEAETNVDGAVQKSIEEGRETVAQLRDQVEPEETVPIPLVVILVLVGVVAAVGGFAISRRRVARPAAVSAAPAPPGHPDATPATSAGHVTVETDRPPPPTERSESEW